MADKPATTRRPRNRRQTIITAAAEQFRTSGYHNVGITDIAAAVGITSAALYRHFANKQDLLRSVIEDTLDRLPNVFTEDDADLDRVLRDLATLQVQGPRIGVLWARELAHLPGDVRSDLRRRLLVVIEPLRTALAAARTDLGPDEVDLLLWTIVGIIAGDIRPTGRISVDAYQRCLVDACLSVCAVRFPADPAPTLMRSREGGRGLLPASRQEAILTSATWLFGTHGYQAVGVDEIGADVGITGASIYHHFDNKAGILTAALERGLQALSFDLSGALATSVSAEEALTKAVGCFTRVCVEHGRVILTLQNEAINLPQDTRAGLAQTERDYTGEWVALLLAHRPELSVPEAQILARTTISALGSLIAIRHIAVRDNLGGELTALGRALLGLG